MMDEQRRGAVEVGSRESSAAQGAKLPSRSKLRSLLDVTIVVLMVAILLTLSLPVCMALVEQRTMHRFQHRYRASDRTIHPRMVYILILGNADAINR